MNIQSLSTYLKTKTDADNFQQVLGHLSDGLYKTDGSAEEALRRALPYDQAVQVKKLAAEQGVTLDNKAGAQEFLQLLNKTVTAIPVVQLTVALEPKGELVSQIHDWFYRTFHKPVLLDIVVKPEILGGSVVSFNGKYYDYSIAKQTEQLIIK